MNIFFSIALLAVFLTVPTTVLAQTPSIQLTSPNGGEKYTIKEKNKLTISWKASNVPAGSKVCALVAEVWSGADTWPELAAKYEDYSRISDTCVVAKNGKGKISQRLANFIPNYLDPGKHKAKVILFSEQLVMKVDYLGRPYQGDETITHAEDISNGSFTIKAPTSKKAAILQIYEDGVLWEDSDPEPVFKDIALARCENIKLVNNVHSVMKCVWKGVELLPNFNRQL